MNFFDILEEVIEHDIIPKLGWNDLLRFRRVCKTSKRITDHYMRVHSNRAPELEINEAEYSFEHFLRTGLSSESIYVNNHSGYRFYGNGGQQQQEFVQQFGRIVKHLRVKELSVFIFGDELNFLRSFVNIETLEAGCFGIGTHLEDDDKMETAQVKMFRSANYRLTTLPPNLQKLKALRFNSEKQVHILSNINLSHHLLNQCMRLSYASLPFEGGSNPYHLLSSGPPPMRVSPEHARGGQLDWIMSFGLLKGYVNRRSRESEPSTFVYDFANHTNYKVLHDTSLNSDYFLKLCSACESAKVEVKFENVIAEWFDNRGFVPPEIGKSVVSLINMHHKVLEVYMPQLEKISIQSTFRSNVGPLWGHRGRPDWPNLKILSINVDSDDSDTYIYIAPQVPIDTVIRDSMVGFFAFFFRGICRPELTELCLRFDQDVDTTPNTQEIVVACPNLKKLALTEWPGTNKALTKLWAGLPALEELTLESCRKLGNVAFVGKDQRSPLFFNLKRLKKLSLKGVDRMPKITNTLFSMVLCHMKLSHLILTSVAPLKSVTSDGILKLLDGRFAGSIEKFPFTTWSLADVTEQDFERMEKKFKSYYML